MKAYEKNNIIFSLLIISILLILSWSCITRISDFKDYHYLIAKNAARNVGESISQLIVEQKRLVQVFADEHKQLIEKATLSPDDEQIRRELESEVKKYFPDYFSFTVTDKFGVPYFDDFDGLIGDLCLDDLKSFTANHVANPRVHPHPDIYHYDLLASLNISNKDYIFFISFPADDVSDYLKSAQAIGHETILVYKQLGNMIEITVAGARNKKFREDYRLTKNEVERILSESMAVGTSWTVYDMEEENLFSGFITTVLVETAVIFLFFIFVWGLLFSLLKKEEQKRKKAEAIKSEFVTIISHELRTPLTSINGAIKLIENEVLGPINSSIKEYLNIASNNIDRLTNIVNDILDVKKMEMGGFQLSKKNINLVEVVEQSIKENTNYAVQFKVKFEFTKPNKDYIINGDREKLIQVITNLLSNAVKYGAKEDNVKIYFEEKSKSIRVNIEDHGTGLSEGNKDLLFEKFTQFHSREDNVVKGTGLGLNIVKNIIESHDGIVGYERKDNVTVFYISLPLVT